MRPLLERVPLFHSGDLEEARAFYAVKGTAFEAIRSGKEATRPHVRVNGLYLVNLWFGYVQYEGTGVELRLSPNSSSFRAVDGKRGSGLGDYYLYVPLIGKIEAEIPGSIIDCSPARGVAISPGVDQVLRAQPGSARLAVSIRGDALRGRSPAIAPRDVRRVTEYIHANLAQPITHADLVGVSGIAGRTLLKHFRDVHGVSPMRYVRNLRMERVRDELAAGSLHSVGAVALSWGFEHAGRFSVEYRGRFGESPSATLARGRRQ